MADLRCLNRFIQPMKAVSARVRPHLSRLAAMAGAGNAQAVVAQRKGKNTGIATRAVARKTSEMGSPARTKSPSV